MADRPWGSGLASSRARARPAPRAALSCRRSCPPAASRRGGRACRSGRSRRPSAGRRCPIARTGKADDCRSDPEKHGEDDRVCGRMTRRSRPGNPRDDTRQAAHTFPERDHRSRDAMTDFECADGVHCRSLTLVQGVCLARPASPKPLAARRPARRSLWRRRVILSARPARGRPLLSTCADSPLPW